MTCGAFESKYQRGGAEQRRSQVPDAVVSGFLTLCSLAVRGVTPLVSAKERKGPHKLEAKIVVFK